MNLFQESTEVVDLDAILGMSEFTEEESSISGFPSIQVLTHVQKAPNKIKKENPWGLYIPKDAAESLEFTADGSMWKPVTFYSSRDTPFNDASLTPLENEPDIEKHEGFVSQACSFHVVAQSQTEVYEIIYNEGPNQYRYVDVKRRNGQLTKAAQLLDDRNDENYPTHRWVRRYLLKFVDEQGAPLHNSVFMYRAHGGAGGAIGYQINQYFGDIASVYSKARKARVRPGPSFQALCRLSMMFDITKPESARIGYLDPSLVVRPTDKLEEYKETEKRGKKSDLSILRRPLAKLLVSPNSELGCELGALVKENAEFALPPSNTVSGRDDEIARDVQGIILAETCQLFADGSCQGTLQSQEGLITFKAGPDYSHILDEDGPILVNLLGSRVLDFKAISNAPPRIDFKKASQSFSQASEFEDF